MYIYIYTHTYIHTYIYIHIYIFPYKMSQFHLYSKNQAPCNVHKIVTSSPSLRGATSTAREAFSSYSFVMVSCRPSSITVKSLGFQRSSALGSCDSRVHLLGIAPCLNPHKQSY